MIEAYFAINIIMCLLFTYFIIYVVPRGVFSVKDIVISYFALFFIGGILGIWQVFVKRINK